jgi:hypothetical protein
MKKLLLLLAISVSQLALSQTIRRVNNTGIPTAAASPNTIPIYTTIQAAHDAATANDIIMVEPSGLSYGILTCTKKIFIYGNGYYLGPASANKNPDLQANIANSDIAQIYFNTGSAGAEISGISFSNISISDNNITVKRCNGSQIYAYSSNQNHKILQNNIGFLTFNSTQNSFVQNNVIHNAISIDAGSNNNVVENNLFTTLYAGVIIKNALVRNNIDIANSSADLTGSTVTNNLAVNAAVFGTGNGNITGTAAAIFEDPTNVSASFSEDTRWKLKAGSPAIGTGFGGIDMGIYGGAFPYIPSGIPSIPSIYKLAVPSTVTSNTMNITISTKNNN